MSDRPLCIKAVLFDFDGTLTKPDTLDFAAIRSAIGCPEGKPILEFIETIAASAEKEAALSILNRLELEAAEKSEPNPGAEELVAFLCAKKLRVGIISRNSRLSIDIALKNFRRIRPEHFDIIISRDDPARPKPHGEGILLAAQRLGLRPHEILVVGDYVFDIEAGQNAGSPTVLLNNRDITLPPHLASDYTVTSLEELDAIVRLGLPLPAGKLPNHLLRDFLGQAALDDPSVLVQPGVGEDTAAVNVIPEEVIVLKSDPITFVTDSIGKYAVLVNANDIATAGALPRWFLSSLLFPPGTTPDTIGKLMHDLGRTCSRWGITLCGGHTEITDAVTRPVVTGMLVGTVDKKDLLDKRTIQPGDSIIMTKAAGIEGTAIIARECAEQLRRMGMPETEIEQCRQYLDRISVLEEARIASCSGAVSAMHDVTEGGIVTAIEELSAAGGCKLRVAMEKIKIYPLTERLCRLLAINPLGLIGSGCLLICCKPEGEENVCAALTAADIDNAVIGEVLDRGEGIDALYNTKPAAWPHFEVDELARFFQEKG